MLALRDLVARVVEGVAAARALGDVHDDVGTAHQRAGVVAVLREQRHADAGADVDRLALELDRRTQGRGHGTRHRARAFAIGAGQHDRELVATEARHGVAIAQRSAQPVGDLAQHRVAGDVTERVVDALEAVEVEQQHRQPAAGGARRAQRLLDARHQPRAVRQAGERILVGEAQHLLLARGDAFAHVVEAAGELADLVAAADSDARVVVARLHALRAARQFGERSGDRARDQVARSCRQWQADEREQQQEDAQAVEGGQGLVERALQHRVEARITARRDDRHARLVVVVVEREPHLLAAMERLAAQRLDQRGALLRRERRGQVHRRAAVGLPVDADVETAELLERGGESVVDARTHGDPAGRTRRADRHERELVGARAEHDDGARAAAVAAAVGQVGQREALAAAARVEGVDLDAALVTEQHRHVGAEALSMVAQGRLDRRRVARGDRLAQPGIRGHGGGALHQLVAHRRQQALEHALAGRELDRDGLAGVALVGLVDDREADGLQQGHHHREGDEKARTEAAEADVHHALRCGPQTV